MKMPHVTYRDRFTAFMDYVRDESNLAHAAIWRGIKLEMDLVHFDHCFGDEETREQSAARLLEYAEAQLPRFAGSDVARSVDERMQHMITYSEVMQASQMEPHKEAAIWEMWDRSDAQSAEQERIERWRNEY